MFYLSQFLISEFLRYSCRVVRVDFEKNAIETTSAQSPLKHLDIHFGCLVASVFFKFCIYIGCRMQQTIVSES